jgi:hypothetical protein
MDKAEQFKAFLQSLELSDKVKADALAKFNTVDAGYKSLNEDFKTSRDDTKAKNKTLNEELELVKSTLNIDEISVDTIKQSLKDTSDIDKIEEKYQDDIQTLRDELAISNKSIEDNELKYNDMLFKNTIIDKGLLNGFVDEPIARQNITQMIKDKLIYQDGEIFAKDLTTGKVATDLATGKALGAGSIVDNIKATINPMYLNKEVVAGGGNSPITNNNGGVDNKPVDTKKHNSVDSFMKEAFAEIKG